MKYLILSLLLSASCSTYRKPSNTDAYSEISFKTSKLDKDVLRKTYQNLGDEFFEEKFKNSLDRELLFYRSYVNTYYAETMIRGQLKTPSFCFGDAHPENFGFISFNTKAYYVFNDIDDSGICPVGLDILRYFSALRLTPGGEGAISYLAQVFEETVKGKSLIEFNFKKPNLVKANLDNLQKFTQDGNFIKKKNLLLLDSSEKSRLIGQLTSQLNKLRIIDIASYQKLDGGSAGLKRYWVIVEDDQGKQELIEFKETTAPGVSYSSLAQNYYRTSIPQRVWGANPDYYGYILLDNTVYLTRPRADDYIDLSKLSKQDSLKLLTYQVQILALFHKENLNKIGGINSKWIIEGSEIISKRYREAYKQYKK